MRTVAKIVSWIALIAVIVPAFAYLGGKMTLESMKLWMLGATVAWFGTVPFWMGRKDSAESS